MARHARRARQGRQRRRTLYSLLHADLDQVNAAFESPGALVLSSDSAVIRIDPPKPRPAQNAYRRLLHADTATGQLGRYSHRQEA